MYNDIFSENQDREKNAYMNWRMISDQRHNFKVIANGYMKSAISLISICLENNDDKKADELIFPILFNANHSIELYLKAIIWKINQIILAKNYIHNIIKKMDIIDFPKSHDLMNLYYVARKKTKAISDEYKKDFDKYTVLIKEYCSELSSLDFPEDNSSAMSEFTRYSISNHGHDFFYIEKENNVAIDLENLRKKLENISDIFDTVYTCCDNIYESYTGKISC